MEKKVETTVSIPIKENQMEKNMEHKMDTIIPPYRGYLRIRWGHYP